MQTVTFDIVSDEDNRLIMGFLDVLAQEGRIRMTTQKHAIQVRPGKPMTANQLNALVDEAESSPRLSVETIRNRLGL